MLTLAHLLLTVGKHRLKINHAHQLGLFLEQLGSCQEFSGCVDAHGSRPKKAAPMIELGGQKTSLLCCG
jgi:hypothetical protein